MAMQRWTGLGGADPTLDALLDASTVDELVRTADARDAAAVPVDWWQQVGVPAGFVMPLALGAIGLGVLLLLPSGRRR